jgi:hypothetical protein
MDTCRTNVSVKACRKQFFLQASRYTKKRSDDEIVYSACQKARNDGRFTESNISQLKSDILLEFPDVSEDEIIIDVTTSMKYKRFEFDSRETIDYRIGAPIKKIVNLGRFLGIKDEENSFNYIMEGYVLSEALE